MGRKQGKKPKNVVAALGRHLRTPLYQRLAAAGTLRPQDAKFLGVLPSRRWPTEDAREEAAVRADIAHALRTGTADDPELATLVSVLRALDVLDKVVDLGDLGLTKRQARDRAQSIAEGDWAGEAVRQAIDTMNAAVIAATTSAVVTGGAGS